MDQYRLLAGISSGRIDTDHYGSFEIRDGECIVDDYETAAALVRHYSLLGWGGDDPGRPEAGDEPEVLEAEAEDEAEPESEPDETSDSDGSGERVDDEADVEADTDAETVVEVDDEDREIYTCAGMDGDCTRRVDEPGGYCWQHEDQD